jgi:hypothetical protein
MYSNPVDQALMLSTLPYRGARIRGNPRARKLVYGKYLIVYTIDESALRGGGPLSARRAHQIVFMPFHFS